MRRRCSASAATTASRLSRKMSTQMRGFAPAMRVMSRSEPPAAWSGSWPSTRVAPAWLRRTFASACGRWLVTATSRSCAPASIATGRAPSEVTKPCTRAQQLGPGPGGRRQEPGRALEQLGVRPLRAARLGTADRVAADEAGVCPRAAAQTALFVEPTSVTTQSCGREREHLAHRVRAAPRRVPRRGRGRRPRRPRRAIAAGSTASRSWATRRTSGSGSQPRTVAPARRAASAADAPIRPVPTTVMFRSTGRPYPRISSATRNARSSDWRAFRRGSQSVS